MTKDGTITLYQWILKEFTLEGRAKSVSKMAPELAPLIRPGDKVLDLCCGGGPFSFFLEEQGADVTAIDFAPYMIQLAQDEASRRGSTVDFIHADVLTHDLGLDYFDLAAFLGDTVSDFSASSFLQLARKVIRALKPNGRFAIQYIDGVLLFQEESVPGERVQQEQPERITWQYKEYLAKEGAYVVTYANESTGEEYEYTGHIYTAPLIQLAMDGLFRMERSIQLGERSFLDIFQKRESLSSSQVEPRADA
jgi:SAM-dependent methyltransferase